jgi:rhodanese-related sulfurtransferase
MTSTAQKPTTILLVVLLLALAAAPAGASSHAADLAELTVEQVAALVEARDNLHVYDNNGPERYAAGHLPGAVWLRYDAVEAGNLPPDKSATLVFYCANEHCTACHVAARSALGFGYRNVFIMPAGIRGWEKAGMPVEASRRR